MAASKTVLSHNIRYLRKQMGISQEELAHRLEIKRSNIAAYESKNVEPRLRIILELSRVFEIDISTLVKKRLQPNSIHKSLNTRKEAHLLDTNLDQQQKEVVEQFIDKSLKIRKILEGFKSFYAFRKKGEEIKTQEKERIFFDIENFIQLMDYLLNHNENLINGLIEITSNSTDH